MATIFTSSFLVIFLLTAIGASFPLLLASIGETLGEQSGVLNLGIEGVMLIGGYFAFITTLSTGSFFLGAVVGAAAGIIANLILLILSIFLNLSQIVIGLAITFIGEGLTAVLYLRRFSQDSPGVGNIDRFSIPFLADIPVIGEALFRQSGFFWFTLLMVIVFFVMMRYTTFGISVRAAGQKPHSLDASGGNVLLTRSITVVLAGALSGLGGAYLSLVTASTFTPAMTGGLGFVAIVITMLSRGNMIWVAVTSILYGFTVAIGTALQLTSLNIPADIIKVLPFIVVLITLLLLAKSTVVPPALTMPYVRGAR